GVHLGVEDVVDLVFHRAVVADLGHPRVGSANGELATEAVVGVVHLGVLEERQAALFEIGLEAGQLDHFVALLFIPGAAVGNTGLGLGRPGVGDEDANADALAVLLG